MTDDTVVSSGIELQVGTTSTKLIRFDQEYPTSVREGHRATVDVRILEQKWDVTDADARVQAFREIVGEEPDFWWSKHAQWFIDASRNAAGLAIYRYKTPSNLEEWEKDG